MRTFKSFNREDVKEPVQPFDPRSEGEQRFKHMHNPVNYKNLVPGVTDQDHVFNGGDRRYDPPTASYEKGADVAAYDKGLTTEEVENLDELTGIKKSPIKKIGYVMKAGKVMTKTAPHEIANNPETERKFKNRLDGLQNLQKRMTKEDLEHLDEADLTKIDRKTLEALTQLHKHYGQKDPRSKASAERGEAELKRRDNEKKEKMKESTLPPHLAKMFNAKGDFKDPKKHAIYKGIQDRMAKKDLGVDAKDHKSEYSKMRAGMGVDDKATTRKLVGERTLTPGEMKKREQIAKAMGRENPKMDMSKKMAIATASAKKVAEAADEYEGEYQSTLTKKQKDAAKLVPAKNKAFKASMYKQGKYPIQSKLRNEEINLDEAIGDHAALAKYADEHGRLDTDDLHTAAKHMKDHNMGALRRHLQDMDTDPRDKALEYVKKKHYAKLGYSAEEVEYVDEASSAMQSLASKKKSGTERAHKEIHGISSKRFAVRQTDKSKPTKHKMDIHVVTGKGEERKYQDEVDAKDKHSAIFATQRKYAAFGKKMGYSVDKVVHKGMVKEDAEQIDEISTSTLVSYGQKAQKQVKGNQPADPDKLRKRTNREQGIKLAFNKFYNFKAKVPATVKEEAELDEKMSDETKTNINSALGKKTPSNVLRKTTKSARALIALSKLRKESLELDEAKRGRPRKDGSSKPAGSDDEEGGREHIIIQLRKSENLRGSEKKVEFNDNSRHVLNPAHVKKALDMHSGMRPSDKETFEKRLASSHASFTSAVKGEPAPKPKPKISLGGRVQEMRDPSTTRADKGPESVETIRDADGVLHVVKRKGVSKGTVSIGEAKDLNAKNVKAAVKHDCATHVEHSTWGVGNCIPEMHTIEEISEGVGYVTHYDIMFEHGIEQNVPVESLRILASEEHGHTSKKTMKEALKGKQHKIDANHNGEVDGEDFAILRNRYRKFRPKRLARVNEAEEMTAVTVKSAADTQYAKGQQSKENMQQDSINKMKTDPLSSKESVKLPPTQGNKPIGGEAESPARVGGKYSMEEERLENLFNSLSEENQEKFAAMLETEEGLDQLLDFAERQGF